METERSDLARRVADIWLETRGEAGVSQEWMATELGVSKKTIQSWEKGTGTPKLGQALRWFNAIRINPCPYLLRLIYPEMYKDIDSLEDEKLDKALIELIYTMSPIEKRQLIFLMSGNHGSSWKHLLQMFTAHCHINLRTRLLIAECIAQAYEIDLARDEMYCKDDIMPDMEMLDEAIIKARESVLAGKKKYF